MGRKSDSTLPSPTTESPKFPGYTRWLKNVSPEMSWDWSWLVFVRDVLASVTRGDVRKIGISVPPQHGKTEITFRYPLWRMLREPGLRTGLGSYNQKYVNRNSRKARKIARRLGLGFGETDTVDEWELANGSSMVARGAGAGIAGLPLDLFVIDDPFKNRAEADSEAVQQNVYEWYMDDVTPRIQEEGALVIVSTRWGPNDLIGRIQQSPEADNWTWIRLPAVAETQEERDRVAMRTNQPTGLPDPLGRAPGEPLCPERFSLRRLEEKRLTEGVGFESLYQQNPVPRGGLLFSRDWFEVVPMVPSADSVRRVRYWDLAESRKDRSCYTSGVLMASVGSGDARRFYVEDVVRGRWHPKDRNVVMHQTALADRQLAGFVGTWFENPSHDAGNESARDIIAACAGCAVRPDNVSGSGSKELRAEPLAGAAKGRIVYLVAGPWNSAYLTELESFPSGAYKDQVDSSAGAFNKLAVTGGTPEVYRQPERGPRDMPWAAQRGIWGIGR